MTLVYTPYILPYLISVVVAVALILFALRRQELPGVLSFVFLMAGVLIWAAGNALELSALALLDKLLWVRVEYVGAVIIPVAWFMTAALYTGRGSRLDLRWLTLLSIIPVITVVLIWTNESHGLMRYDIWLDSSGPFAVVRKTYGPWFWVHLLFSYSLILAGAYLLVHSLYRHPHLYRGQAVAWLTAASVPILWNLLYTFGLSPFQRLDLTPAAFAISGVALVWGWRRYRLFEIIPMARDTVIECMAEGVLVLDVQFRVVDSNPRAREILGKSIKEVIGRSLADLIPSLHARLEEFSHEEGETLEVQLGEAGRVRIFELRLSTLAQGGSGPMGYILIMLDVTENRALQARLEQLSLTDELTGLYNRRGFMLLAQQQLNVARRMGRPMQPLFADLDSLKQINDRIGHYAGDQALVALANILRGTFRKADLVSRLSGDEFAILVNDVSSAEVDEVLRRFHEALLAHNRSQEHGFPLSVSLGTAPYDPTAPVSLEELLRLADSMMYREKTRLAARRTKESAWREH